MTDVVVAHLMESVRRIADHVLMLDHGQVILDGSAEGLEASEDGRTSTKDYLGDLLGQS